MFEFIAESLQLAGKLISIAIVNHILQLGSFSARISRWESCGGVYTCALCCTVDGSTLVPCAVLWRGLHLCPVLLCGGVYTYALCCGGVYTYALYYTMNCGGVYTLNLGLESDWIQVYSVGSTFWWKFLWQFSMLSMEWSQVIPLWHSFWEIYLKRVCFLDFERFIYLFKDCFVSSRLCDCKDSSWLSDVP